MEGKIKPQVLNTDNKEVAEKPIKNILSNQIIEIALIKRNPDVIRESGEDVALLKGCSMEIIPEVDSNDNIKRVLTEEESTFLEKHLGLEEGDLNPYKREHNFWVNNRNSKLVFTRTSNSLESATVRLDLSNPYDFIKYKIALASKLVSPKWESRYENPDWKFAIRYSEDETNELKQKVKKEEAVMEYILNNKNNKSKLYNLLLLFNNKAIKSSKSFTHNQSAEWYKNQLWLYTKNAKDIDILYNIITWKEEEKLDKVFILTAMISGAVIVYGGTYKLSSGGILGHSEQEAIDYFKIKDNQPIKLSVQKTIEDFYK
jgi:hypothetical protein